MANGNALFFIIQWNPSCEATPFALEKWPFKRGGLLSGVEINTFMFKFTLSSGLSRGGALVRVASQKGFHCITTYFNPPLSRIALVLKFICAPAPFQSPSIGLGSNVTITP